MFFALSGCLQVAGATLSCMSYSESMIARGWMAEVVEMPMLTNDHALRAAVQQMKRRFWRPKLAQRLIKLAKVSSAARGSIVHRVAHEIEAPLLPAVLSQATLYICN